MFIEMTEAHMPGKRTFGLAVLELIGAAVSAADRQARNLDHLPRSLLRDLNLPCCGPLPQN